MVCPFILKAARPKFLVPWSRGKSSVIGRSYFVGGAADKSKLEQLFHHLPNVDWCGKVKCKDKVDVHPMEGM